MNVLKPAFAVLSETWRVSNESHICVHKKRTPVQLQPYKHLALRHLNLEMSKG